MLFQYGTMAGIMEGAFSGSITLEELLKHGNFGIGTFDGLDGEMIIVDGKIYKTDYYGNSTIQPTSTTTPFASITTFKAKYKKKGAPKIEVITPMGTSTGDKIILPTVSQNNKNTPP